ncbi:MAG: PpiC-type peptidyl-prolyl cis-trans isomerase [Paenibacillaceae bacterium]|jgi:hypothetical protein|nr:PpiC-type peptidyl-prolyl cis-trans isomerase [Paenibacillaceae bacterium]
MNKAKMYGAKKQAPFRSRKWGIFTAISVIIILAVIVLIVSTGNGRNTDWKTLASVNDEPITVREFKMMMEKYRAAIYTYFNQKYGVNHSEHFWYESFQGEKPEELLRQKTLEELIFIKVQQILFKEEGLVRDIGYKSFLKDFKEENIRRKKSIDEKKIFFGPEQYSENQYYDYLFSNQVIKLKEKLSREKLETDDGELKQYYSANKDQKYRKIDSFKLEKITVKADPEGNTAQSVMEDILKKLNDGEALSRVAAKYSKEETPEVSLEEVILNEAVFSQNTRELVTLKSAAEKLEEGQTGNVFTDDGFLTLIHCVERKDGGYYLFDDVKGMIGKEILDEKYNKYIEHLVGMAKVKIVEDVFHAVHVR